jgi:hypothetical protein
MTEIGMGPRVSVPIPVLKMGSAILDSNIEINLLKSWVQGGKIPVGIGAHHLYEITGLLIKKVSAYRTMPLLIRLSLYLGTTLLFSPLSP